MTMIFMMAKIIVNENNVQNPADMNIFEGSIESPIFETLQVPRMSWQMSQVENMPFRNIFSFVAQFQTERFELLYVGIQFCK